MINKPKMLINSIRLLLRITFNKSNLRKIMYIFILGLIYRVFNSNINTVLDYLSQSSVISNLFFSLFIVIIHELIEYFYIENTMSCVFNFYTSIIRMFSYKNILKHFYSHYLIEDKMLIASNINKMEPYREIGSSNKPSFSSSPINSSSLPPTNIRITCLKAEAKAESSEETSLTYQEKDRLITKYKDEFKEFYTTRREFIKLSNYELEKLNIKVALAYSNGA